MATKAQEVIREKKPGVPEGGPVRQVTDFLSGNESAAKAASAAAGARPQAQAEPFWYAGHLAALLAAPSADP